MVIIQPIDDFSNKYMVSVNPESFKTLSLTPHTLPKSKLSIFLFSKISIRYQNFEFLLEIEKKEQEFNFNFLVNPSIHLYKHTSDEIVC